MDVRTELTEEGKAWVRTVAMWWHCPPPADVMAMFGLDPDWWETPPDDGMTGGIPDDEWESW